MAQSYPEPWMDKYWNLRHLLLDVAHLGRDEFARVAGIMGTKFSKGETGRVRCSIRFMMMS